MRKLQVSFSVFIALFFPAFVFLPQSLAAQENRPPVIIIPGMIGSELINQQTKEVVWFKLSRSKTDDLRLPLAAVLAESRDHLVPRDILRSVKVGFHKTEVYGGLIDFLKTRGYRERSWDNPQAEGAIYVFAYDWRRDNVENARLLVRKIETAKARLNLPDLRFNVVAHSMGGLISRYAAMYGDAELPAENPRPTWAGARHFNKIFLLGTPNHGALLSLNSLVTGFTPLGIKINLPFIQNVTRFDSFAIPSVYQLLPHQGTLRVFDENLRPVRVDIYDPQTWDKYGWNPMTDKKFASHFSAAERSNARAFFTAALERARRFQAALGAVNPNAERFPAMFHLVGSDCKETLDGVVIRRVGNIYKTIFKPASFSRPDGRQVSAAELKKLMFAPGDGIVSKRSLTQGGETVWRSDFRCAEHNFLPAKRPIQTELLKLLASN